MSGDTHVHGVILIVPPVIWAETADLPEGWLNIDRSDRDVLLRVVQDEERTDEGVVQRRTVDAIIPAPFPRGDLVEHVQDIVDRFGRTHTFRGRFDCSYAHGEDVWRIYVRKGRAVEVRPTWPDETEEG